MSSTTDNLQWQIQELQEEKRNLKKQKEWLLNYIYEMTDSNDSIMNDVKDSISIWEKGNNEIAKLVENHIGLFESYTYTELDEFYLYEFRYEADRILWSDELFDLKERLNEIPNMEPLACLGVGTSEDAFPILTIEFWKEK